MHNGARAAHVCLLERRNLLIGNAITARALLLRALFSTAKDLHASFLLGARIWGGEGRRGGEEGTKNGEIETPRFTPRSRRDAREAATAGIRAVHARTLSPFPLSRQPFVISYIFITRRYIIAYRSILSPPAFFLLSFSRLSFHLRGHARHTVPVTVHRYPRSA